MKTLSIIEFGRLKTLEKVIDRGKVYFIEVGNALAEIRDTHLYREKHDTFEDYCHKRWGWGARRAYQFIDAAAVAQPLTKRLRTIVHNEGQARALAKVPEAQREEVLKTAKKEAPVITAKVIKETHEKINRNNGAGNGNGHTDLPKTLDDTGYVVPQKALTFWERRHEVQSLIDGASEIKSVISRAWNDGKDPDILFFGKGKLNQTFLTDLDNIVRHLKTALPYAVCPYCQGKVPENCAYCNKTGVIDRQRFNAAPQEILKLREKGVGK